MKEIWQHYSLGSRVHHTKKSLVVLLCVTKPRNENACISKTTLLVNQKGRDNVKH